MKLLINIIACFFLLFSGCKKKGCFESSGTRTTTVRTAGSINEIDANDNINIVLTQDTVEAIAIEAGDHLQPLIKADLKNNVLTLRNNSGCSWLKGPSEEITAYISVKTLGRINLYGSGTVSSTNTLTNPSLYVAAYEAVSPVTLSTETLLLTLVILNENSEYTIRGFANYATVYCGEKGTMNLQDLHTNIMDLDQRSIRDAYVWVTDSLGVRVQYRGNVYYKGNPPNISYQHYNDGRLLPLQ